MSTTTTGNENMPLYLGLAVIVIILIAYVSNKQGEETKATTSAKKGGKKAKSSSTGGTTSASKKSKKKKSGSKANKAAATPAPVEKKVVIQEPEPEPQAPVEPEVKSSSAATKKKKKKAKKKAKAAAVAPKPDSTPASTDSSRKVSFNDDDDDSDDDDFDFTVLQSASKRQGANDAAKRAAVNKERERQKALKKAEEKAKADAKKAAEAKAAAEAAAAAEASLKAAAAAGAKALSQAEAEKKAAAAAAAGEAAKLNGATNGEAAAEATGEKKKKKKKKRKGKGASVEESRAPLVKPAAPPTERWETVPQTEDWQEVSTKHSKNKSKMDSVDAGDNGSNFISDESPSDEVPGEISATMATGGDPLIFIGKGGSTIQNLQQTSGAKFHLNRQTNVLTISGMEDAVQLGLAAAQSILAAEAERKANESAERVTWGSDAIKAVIGRKGATIKATQEATGCRIDADVEAGTLVIVGPTDQVAIALTMCNNAAFGEVQEVLELGSRNAVNLVYGPNFQTIRSMQDATGAKLDIARGTTTLKLAGSSEAVAEATAQIRALLEANRGFEMTIENSKVGAVYGKGGETLRSIQDRTGTQIDVSRGPTHATVSVMGTVEASSRARNMLQRAIDGEVELQPGEVAEEIELGNATAAVIGRGGSNVAALEKTHGVKINVRSELQKARVVGKPDKVAAAAKAITAIAKPILDAEEAQKKADKDVQSGESAWQVDAAADDTDGW